MVERKIHDWFGLSYAQYLTIPRSIMEAMPTEWQLQFTKLLEELDDTYDWRPEGQYRCTLHNPDYDYKEEFNHNDEAEFDDERFWGPSIHDPLESYRYPNHKYISSLKKELDPRATAIDQHEKEVIIMNEKISLESVKEQIHNCEYGHEMDKLDKDALKEAGIVIVYGYSDDNTEFEGAIYEEIGSYGGAYIRLTKDGLLENKCSDDDCPYYTEEAKKAKYYIKPKWCDGNADIKTMIAWTYESNIPHITFDVLEDDEIFCRGMIFRLSDLVD